LPVFIFSLALPTLQNGRSAITVENTPIFYNSYTVYIFRTVPNTAARHAGFWIVLVYDTREMCNIKKKE
jgi:hypothetical protein